MSHTDYKLDKMYESIFMEEIYKIYFIAFYNKNENSDSKKLVAELRGISMCELLCLFSAPPYQMLSFVNNLL